MLDDDDAAAAAAALADAAVAEADAAAAVGAVEEETAAAVDEAVDEDTATAPGDAIAEDGAVTSLIALVTSRAHHAQKYRRVMVHDVTGNFLEILRELRAAHPPKSQQQQQPTRRPGEHREAATVSALVRAATEVDREIAKVLSAVADDRQQPETLLRQCCETVDALKQLVDAACARAPRAKDAAAHMSAVIASLYSRLDDAAQALQARRSALLARERARLARYDPQSALRSRQLPPSPSLPASAKQKPPQAQQEPEPEQRSPQQWATEEERELAAENRLLVRRLAATTDDALRGIERQIAEIAEMQRVVAMKALEQAQDVDSLHEQAERSVAAVAEANERLARALRKKRSSWCDCHTIVVANLFVMGTMLLFLNWLHP